MSVKLYRHNESGDKILAKYINEGVAGGWWCIAGFGVDKTVSPYEFQKNYTALPEAPEVGSTAWAVNMLNNGEKLENPTEVHGDYIYKVMDEVCFADGWVFRDFQNYLFRPNHTWRLYSPPKPIVELLPHEFVEGQEVFCRYKNTVVWLRGTYQGMSGENAYLCRCDMPKDKKYQYDYTYFYCIPYAGNEHLEGTVTDAEHGAVPKGYMPPHVPKLGESDYWCVGDETFCLVNGDGHVHDEDTGINFNKPYTMCISLCGEMAHTWYDKYGKEDVQNYRTLFHRKAVKKLDNGKFEIDFNYAPTRPHRIESCTTCDGTDDVESCAYCKDKE